MVHIPDAGDGSCERCDRVIPEDLAHNISAVKWQPRWGKLCTVHKKTTHQIRFVRLLMPEAMSVDADGGLDSDDDDGDE